MSKKTIFNNTSHYINIFYIDINEILYLWWSLIYFLVCPVGCFLIAIIPNRKEALTHYYSSYKHIKYFSLQNNVKNFDFIHLLYE